MVLRQCWLVVASVVSCRKDCSWSLMESFSVLMSSREDEEDDDNDNEDEDDDDGIELSLERREYSTEKEDEEDKESNILCTNVDSPSNNLVSELWSCHHSSIVLDL